MTFLFVLAVLCAAMSIMDGVSDYRHGDKFRAYAWWFGGACWMVYAIVEWVGK